MSKFTVELVMRETYVIEVEAKDETEAYELAEGIDIMHWNPSSSITVSMEVTNV